MLIGIVLLVVDLVQYATIPLADESVRSAHQQLIETPLPANEPKQTIQANREWRLVKFDPNRTSAKAFYAMGFTAQELDKIFDYKRRQGFFTDAASFTNLWQETGDRMRIEPYVAFTPIKKKPSPNSTSTSVIQVDVSTASAEELQQLKGIGKVLGNRIVRFRDKLGGFHSTGQLAEVYGIDSSLVKELTEYLTCSGKLRKLDINQPDSVLRQHPYCSWKLARLVDVYRHEHGPYHDLEILRMVRGIDPKELNRLWPYLTVD